ncbi:MAG: class I SAM-dependent methyltransferase [Desulfobacterales bacterium]|jgi:predicted O-methyltransferase YrrM|nr:class I SAM-dependent methyltransferase [Desulfobacterales bacterium]
MPPDLDLIRAVKGFLADDEGLHLYRAALEAAHLGPCLEIGSYCGKSTVCIGTACRESGRVLFAIDHHRGSEEQQPGEAYFDPALFDPAAGRVDTFRHFRDTLSRAGLQETVVPIVCRSELAARAWAAPLGFVFIDGGHAFDTVSADYRDWSPHLMPGGLLAFHDVFPDPSQGGQAPYQIYRQALDSGLFREHSLIQSLAVLERKP